MAVSVDFKTLEQLISPDSKTLHHVNDSLGACGVKNPRNVPTVVVVGERSSGKSSVLEALSRIPFPKEAVPCTRFATLFIFRRASKPRVQVKIQWADRSKRSKVLERSTFHQNDLADIIKEANEFINFTPEGTQISRDVLRLEIEGPELHPLALLDLPGLLDPYATTERLEENNIADDLLKTYASLRKCIVLAVFSSRGELFRHVAMKKLLELDPTGDKTLGILTKPDLLEPGGDDESTYRQVARNLDLDAWSKLKLGWHVLCNKSNEEPNFEVREKQEAEFFQTGAWATLSREDVGITSLRKKLSRLLFERLRCGLPDAIRDIEAKLRTRQDALCQLGEARSTPEEMRSFLITSAENFQSLTRSAIQGRYNSDPFFGDIDSAHRKLRAQVRNMNQVFNYVMLTKGHHQVVTSDLGFQPPKKVLPEYLQSVFNNYYYNFDEPKPITMKDLNTSLTKQAATNQGQECPGLPNQDLVIQLFQRQATPWRKIAEFHIERVVLVARAFIDELVRHVTGPSIDTQTAEAILLGYVDSFFADKETVLHEKLEELLRPYSQGYAAFLDDDFYQTVVERSNKPTDEGWYESLAGDRVKKPCLGPGGTQVPGRSQVSDALSAANAPEGAFFTRRVIDMTQTYYEMCRRTFAENVINLAIESCLISEIPNILTPTLVSRLSDDRVAEMAAESEATQLRRRYLEEDIETLHQGLAEYRRFQPRITAMGPLKAEGGSSASAKNTNLSGTFSRTVNSAAKGSPSLSAKPPSPSTSRAGKGPSSNTIQTPVKQPGIVPSGSPSGFSSIPPHWPHLTNNGPFNFATRPMPDAKDSNFSVGKNPSGSATATPVAKSGATPTAGGIFGPLIKPQPTKIDASSSPTATKPPTTSLSGGSLFGTGYKSAAREPSSKSAPVASAEKDGTGSTDKNSGG